MTEVAVIQPAPDALVSIISRAASDPSIDIDKMERLLAMHERLVAGDARKAYAAAMSLAQSEMGTIGVNKENTVTRSKYATYAKLDHVLRPIYTKHGFALSFNSSPAREDWVNVLCLVSHGGGHSEQFSIEMPADGKGAKGGDVMTKTHATGSAMSYGMRYLLRMIFNVAVGETDDDGNGASVFPRVSKEQADEIRQLIKETNYDMERFLRIHGNAPSIEEMHAVSHGPAVNLLRSKLAAKKRSTSVAQTVIDEQGTKVDMQKAEHYLTDIREAVFAQDDLTINQLYDEMDTDMQLVVHRKLSSQDRTYIRNAREIKDAE